MRKLESNFVKEGREWLFGYFIQIFLFIEDFLKGHSFDLLEKNLKIVFFLIEVFHCLKMGYLRELLKILDQTFSFFGIFKMKLLDNISMHFLFWWWILDFCFKRLFEVCFFLRRVKSKNCSLDLTSESLFVKIKYSSNMRLVLQVVVKSAGTNSICRICLDHQR